MKKSIFTTFAAVTAMLLTSAVNATLIGDEIDVELSGGLSIVDQSVLVDNGVEFEGGNASTNFGAFLFPLEFMDVGADTVTMVFETSLGSDAMLTFSDLDFGLGIADVIFSSSIAEISLASFTDSSFTLDMSAWFSIGGPANIDITLIEAVAVSEPSTLLLLGLGIIGLGVVRRKKVL